MLTNFCFNNLETEITIYVNNVKYYSGIGRNAFEKLKKAKKEFSYTEIFKFGNKEGYFVIKESSIYITIPKLITISTYLYGGKNFLFKGTNPYELEIKKCGKTSSCSLYKQGMCSATKRLLSGCPNIVTICQSAGYKTQKGQELRSQGQKAAKNNTLKDFDGHFWVVGDEYYFHIPYLNLLKHKETGEYFPSYKVYYSREDYVSLGENFKISKEEATKEFFDIIFSAEPRAIFGGTINDYQEKIVPRLKIDILKTDIELAKNLGIENVNYVGRFAILKTLKPGITTWDRDKKYHLYWDGETVEVLNSESLCSISWIGDYHSGTIKLVPSDRLVVTIEDNDWVLPTTEFKNSHY